MTRSRLARIALPVSAALLGGTFTAVGAAAPAQAGGSQAVSGSYDYECRVVVGGLDLGMRDIGVTASATVPATVFRGERIAPTPVTISLRMPDDLRDATTGMVGGTHASGQSADSFVTLASAGKALKVAIPALASPKLPIPMDAPWIIPAAGNVPAITTPAFTTGSATLSMPQRFTVTATVYRPDGNNAAATMDCTTADALLLGTLKQANAAPTAKKSVKAVSKKGKKAVVKVGKLKAKDLDGDRLTYKITKKAKKKAGTAKIKGTKITFTPKKSFKGKKAAFVVTVRDGKGGAVKTKIVVKIKR